MKTKLAFLFAFLFSVLLLGLLIQTAYGFSQTSELNQGVYTLGIAVFNLQAGDQVEGSFSVSNLGPYPLGPLALATGHSGTSYEVVEVWVEGPNRQIIFNYSATPSMNSFNFNFTANEKGIYSMSTFSGAMDYLKDAKNPVITINYNIINATAQPSPSPSVSTPLPTPSSNTDGKISQLILPLIAAAVLAIVIISVLLFRKYNEKVLRASFAGSSIYIP
jgi:hypothetical protein